jgi:Tol biopolymer transport system component
MSLAVGEKLGPYEIQSALGAGGMGEVYKALDTRLDRVVAIKILPEVLAADPQFRIRFDREARSISQLDHPHICALYDVGEQAGTAYLVMQYLEGETLAHRLTKSALPLDQALQVAIQIADALAAAHKAGIVHRDLKPGNVILTKNGAKLLDFGLAKSTRSVAGVGLSMLPTTPPLTQQGSILGTFQYMAPEQLEGHEADARTDIFAFGAVIYETVTGKKAFDGKSQASLIGAIMHAEPKPISTLQPLTPPALDRVIGKCLAKEPDDRWQTAKDLKDALSWIGTAPSSADTTVVTAPRPRAAHYRLAWSVVALLVVALIAALGLGRGGYLSPASVDALAYRTSILPPPGVDTVDVSAAAAAGRFALSPDGRLLAFIARGADNRVLLWVRPLNALTSQALAGTDGAAYPFWSPDSKSIAFVAERKLKRVDASGGPVLTVSDRTAPAPGAWSRDNRIVFTPVNNSPLHIVPASGGASVPVTTLDSAMGHIRHIYPFFLPDGRHFLYFAVERDTVPGPIYVGSLDPAERSKLLMERGSVAKYAQGYLLFTRESTLMAQAFDASRLTISGDAVSLAGQVETASNTGVIGAFSVSETGAVVYQSESGAPSQLTWFDRSGRVTGKVGMPGEFCCPAVSPDGNAVAVARRDGQPRTIQGGDIWLYDLVRGTNPRFTFDGESAYPVWSPDGHRLAFYSGRESPGHVYQIALSGAGHDEVLGKPLGEPPRNTKADDWSRDGRYIIEGLVGGGKTGNDIWVLPLFGDRKPFPYLQTEFNEANAKLSPNGQWLAYVSNETKRNEVYVQSFPAPGGKWQVSTSGGDLPVWSRAGKELFFRGADQKLMAVEVRSGAGKTGSTNGAVQFEAGVPMPLFSTRFGSGGYDVSPNGLFIMPVLLEQAAAPLTVVVNWPALLKK